jgi:hypothetical protein
LVTDKSYSFTISGGYTPKTIPMERLGEYMAALARMLGEETYVHFESVVEGSVALKARVDEPARTRVRERVRSVRTGAAPAEVRRHYTQLDDMLRKDNAYAALAGGDDVVVPFPGRKRAEPVVYGPFRQQGTIDGEVYRIGGKDASKHIHVHSADRDLSVLYASESVALRLRHHLFGGTLRFRGEGTWFRHDDGTWELRNFRVDDFEELSDASLIETVARLRAVGGDEFGEDPVGDLLAERHGGEKAA